MNQLQSISILHHDLTFWVLSLVALGSNILSVLYCLAYKKAKRELKQLQNHLNNTVVSITKPTNSAMDKIETNIQSKGDSIY